MLAIECRELVKRYQSTVAVDRLSLAVDHGEVVGLLGPNGAGKTTTISMVCGLIRPDAGCAAVEGLDVASELTAVRRRIGVVFQEAALYDSLTAWENLIFHGRLHRMSRRQLTRKAEEALEMVQLSAHRKRRVNTFSGGMRRRLVLARSLMHAPSVLLLDEPTLGIDVQARNAIWERIRQLRDEGRGILLCTNYMEEADWLSDRIIIIDLGRVVACDRPQAMKERVGGSPVRLTVANLPDQADARLVELGAHVVAIEPLTDGRCSLTLRLIGGGDVLPGVLDYLNRETRIVTIYAHEPSLNDVFLSLTGRALRD